LGIIALLTLLILVAINPFRNVLLGDDSIYVKSVQRLAEKGQFQLGPGITPTMIFPVVWGWLFTLPFGFSISAVVFSVVPLALIGLAAFYATILEFDNSRTVALLGTMAVLTSPIYVRLLASFMSDVPFVSLMFVSIFLYVRGLKSGSRTMFLLGSIALSLSILTRQTGIALAGAVAMAMVYRAFSQRRMAWQEIAAGLALPALTIIGYEFWLHYLNGETWAQRNVVAEPFKQYASQWKFPFQFVDSIARYAFLNLLLAVPFLAIRPLGVPSGVKILFRRPWLTGAVFLTVVLLDAVLTPHGTPMFWVSGVLYWMGLKFFLQYWGWVAVVLVLLIIGLYCEKCFTLLNAFRTAWDAPTFLLVSTVLALISITSLLPPSHSYDRYLLPVFPLTGLIWIGRNNQRMRKSFPIGIMAFSLLWGVWVTKFSYDVASVQWREAEELVAGGVKRSDIRGSWAWEGWNLWDDCLINVSKNGGTAASQNDCWGTQTPTPYRIKLHRLMGLEVEPSIDGYYVGKLISVKTWGVPSEVRVMISRSAR
jgi:hypothetical protein